MFGKVKRKEPFFASVSANTASAYYSTVESLWQLSSVTDRKHFLKAVQQQWTQTYRDNHDAREPLFAQAKACTLETTTHTVPTFVETLSREEALHRREENCLAKKTQPQASSSSSESRGTPLHAMLDALGIDRSKLLTDEVRAKVSVMESLEEMARLWVVYEEEKRAYHHLSTFQWKNSSINAGMSGAKSLVTVVKDRMVAVASLQIW